MEEIFAIADRVTVIRNGKYIATRSIDATNRSDLVSLMVGGKRASAARDRRTIQTVPILECSSLSGRLLRDVSFSLRPGEILGLGGLHGQGQSELLLTLFGASKASSGSVTLNGRDGVFSSSHEALRAGIAYVSGDRGRTGALHGRSILENLVWLISHVASVSPLDDRA